MHAIDVLTAALGLLLLLLLALAALFFLLLLLGRRRLDIRRRLAARARAHAAQLLLVVGTRHGVRRRRRARHRATDHGAQQRRRRWAVGAGSCWDHPLRQAACRALLPEETPADCQAPIQRGRREARHGGGGRRARQVAGQVMQHGTLFAMACHMGVAQRVCAGNRGYWGALNCRLRTQWASMGEAQDKAATRLITFKKCVYARSCSVTDIQYENITGNAPILLRSSRWLRVAKAPGAFLLMHTVLPSSMPCHRQAVR
jgi:hypothetical protein